MPDTHGGNIFKFSHDHNVNLSKVSDFSANINPLGPSQKGLDSLNKRLRYISHYPDVTNDDVINAIADIYGIEKGSILLGNGAAELLYVIGRLSGFTGAFVPAPGFSEYQASMDAAKIPVRDIFYRQRQDDDGMPYFEVPYLALQTFAAELKGQDGRIIVFLGNPNNPDGTLLDKQSVKVLAQMLKDANSLLVIDESFIDFIGNESLRDNSYSMRELINQYDNVIIIHSFTKFYAVPGLRIGAAFANPTLTQELHQYIPAWSVNTLAQAYIESALTDTKYINDSKMVLANEAKYMYESLTAIKDLIVYKPSANYILIEINNPDITVTDVQTRLEKHNLLIRSCANYKGLGPKWMRIAIKDHAHNVELIHLLSTIFKK